MNKNVPLGALFLITLILIASCAGPAHARDFVGRPAADVVFAPSRLAVSGSPEQIGNQIGASCGPVMAKLVPVVLEQLKSQTGLGSDERLYARASRLAATLDPRDVAELEALAKAAGIDYRDVLCLNLYYSLSTRPLACRQIAAWGPASANGRVLHGRNLDYHDLPGQMLSRHNLILNVKPDDGVEYLILTWPGHSAAITGTNRAGLTVAANALTISSPKPRLAEPAFFTLKRILRTCRTVQEAVDAIQEARPLDDMSIMVSDVKTPAAIVVEIWGGNVRLREPAEGGHIIGNANHLTTDACPNPTAREPADKPTCSAARTIGLPLDVRKMQKVLAHPSVVVPYNLVSVVFDPSMNRMFLSCGRPAAAKGTFTEYVLFPDQPNTQPSSAD